MCFATSKTAPHVDWYKRNVDARSCVVRLKATNDPDYTPEQAKEHGFVVAYIAMSMP